MKKIILISLFSVLSYSQFASANFLSEVDALYKEKVQEYCPDAVMSTMTVLETFSQVQLQDRQIPTKVLLPKYIGTAICVADQRSITVILSTTKEKSDGPLISLENAQILVSPSAKKEKPSYDGGLG